MVGADTHNHGLGAGAAQIGSPIGNANALGFKSSQIGSLADSAYSVGNSPSSSANGHPNRSHNTALTGTTDGGNNIQRTKVVYAWERVA